jgi:hypothetical protein
MTQLRKIRAQVHTINFRLLQWLIANLFCQHSDLLVAQKWVVVLRSVSMKLLKEEPHKSQDQVSTILKHRLALMSSIAIKTQALQSLRLSQDLSLWT